jgi:tRNA A-37 threonylcarbamoyl transferase component Bud32
MDPQLIAELKGRLGTTIGGRWQLVKLLGLGASAAVYRAVDREGWRVAVKIMHSKFLHSEIVQQRFFREQQILDQIQHENTLRIFETDRTPTGIPFIVMELLEGVTLARLMHKRGEVPLELERVIEFTIPVLRALEVCHAKKIIHRDLKPANVFVTRERVVKLLDFGVARYHQDGVHLTRDGTALGTPAFMAPEQASGHMDLLDERSDLFSVGAMMHYLLSGQYLHEGKTAEETYVKAATTPAPSLARRASHLQADIIRVVDRAVSWNAGDRWQTAQEFTAQLHTLLEARQVKESRQRVDTLRGWSSVGRAALADAVDQEPRDKEHERALLDVWQAIDRAMQTMQRYGADHAMSKVRREECHAILEAELQSVGEIYWDVRPYSFDIPGTEKPCWEPSPPLDRIPYELFASGVRRVRFDTKITQESFLGFLGALVLDPDRDLAPEDDLATAIWDKRLVGVELEIGAMSASVDMANHNRFERAFTNQLNAVGEAVRSELQLEYERLQILNQLGEGALLEAEVMLTSNPKKAREESVSPNDDVKARMSEEDLLKLQIAHRAQQESWVRRLGTTMGDLIAQAKGDGDASRWVAPFSELSSRLAFAGRVDEFLALFGVMMRRLRHPQVRRELVSSAINAELLREMFHGLGIIPKRQAAQTQDELSEEALVAITLIVDYLDTSHLEVVLEALGSSTPSARQLHPALLENARNHIAGNESLLGQVLQRANEELAEQIIDLLTSSGQAGIEALRAGLENPSEVIRLRILEQLASQGGYDLNATLEDLSWSPSPRTRLQSLQTAARMGLRGFIPNFIARMKNQDFHHFPIDERRLNFELLMQLSSAAAEQVAIELLNSRDLLGGQALNTTRVIAADHLGKHGTSKEAYQALDAARRRRPWGSREVQEAAQRGIDQYETRAAKLSGGMP